MKDMKITIRVTKEQHQTMKEICEKKKTLISLHLREMVDRFIEENKDGE